MPSRIGIKMDEQVEVIITVVGLVVIVLSVIFFLTRPSPQQLRLERMIAEIRRRKDALGDTPRDRVMEYIYYNMLDQLHYYNENASDVSRSASIMATGMSGIMLGWAMRDAKMTQKELEVIWQAEQKSIENID